MKPQEVRSFYAGDEFSPVGSYRVRDTLGGHPADRMTIDVVVDYGAIMSIVNPQSFADGGPEWVCRYGNIVAIRYTVASLLESYDYLVSSEITSKEAIRRLRIMRAVRRTARQEQDR